MKSKQPHFVEFMSVFKEVFVVGLYPFSSRKAQKSDKIMFIFEKSKTNYEETIIAGELQYERLLISLELAGLGDDRTEFLKKKKGKSEAGFQLKNNVDFCMMN